MEIIRSYVISNEVIEHKRKLDKSILEVVYKLKETYSLLQMFWAEQSLCNHFP